MNIVKSIVLEERWEQIYFDESNQHSLVIENKFAYVWSHVAAHDPSNHLINFLLSDSLLTNCLYAKLSLDQEFLAIQTSNTTIEILEVHSSKRYNITIKSPISFLSLTASRNQNVILPNGIIWSDHGGNSQDIVVVTTCGLEIYKVSALRHQCRLSRHVQEQNSNIERFWYESSTRVIILRLAPTTSNNAEKLNSTTSASDNSYVGYILNTSQSETPILELPPPDKISNLYFDTTTMNSTDIFTLVINSKLYCVTSHSFHGRILLSVDRLTLTGLHKKCLLDLSRDIEPISSVCVDQLSLPDLSFAVVDNVLITIVECMQIYAVYDIFSNTTSTVEGYVQAIFVERLMLDSTAKPFMLRHKRGSIIGQAQPNYEKLQPLFSINENLPTDQSYETSAGIIPFEFYLSYMEVHPPNYIFSKSDKYTLWTITLDLNRLVQNTINATILPSDLEQDRPERVVGLVQFLLRRGQLDTMPSLTSNSKGLGTQASYNGDNISSHFLKQVDCQGRDLVFEIIRNSISSSCKANPNIRSQCKYLLSMITNSYLESITNSFSNSFHGSRQMPAETAIDKLAHTGVIGQHPPRKMTETHAVKSPATPSKIRTKSFFGSEQVYIPRIGTSLEADSECNLEQLLPALSKIPSILSLNTSDWRLASQSPAHESDDYEFVNIKSSGCRDSQGMLVLSQAELTSYVWLPLIHNLSRNLSSTDEACYSHSNVLEEFHFSLYCTLVEYMNGLRQVHDNTKYVKVYIDPCTSLLLISLMMTSSHCFSSAINLLQLRFIPDCIYVALKLLELSECLASQTENVTSEIRASTTDINELINSARQCGLDMLWRMKDYSSILRWYLDHDLIMEASQLHMRIEKL